MGQYTVGVDLGGTNVKALLRNREGDILAYRKEKTRAEQGPPGVIGQIAELVLAVIGQGNIRQEQVKGLGLGLPGVINSQRGVAVVLPNLPGWQDIPVGELLQERLGLPVYCENDVRMAAWGEKFFGAGRDYRDLVCLTLGTGIGAGIFLAGKLWRGQLGSAGEIGHMTVEKDGLACSCGNKGCLEMYASGQGIARRAQRAVRGKESNLLYRLSAGEEQQITAATVQEAAGRGDELALEIVRETADYLGLALANLANILNPQLFILGGGVACGWGELLLAPLREVVAKRAMSLNSLVEIKPAQLGEQAGALGASYLAYLKFCAGQDLRPLYW